MLLLQFLERSPRMLPDLLVHLGVTAVAVGTSMHLVVDSVTLRLVRDGYELHLSVRENPLLTNLTTPALVSLVGVSLLQHKTENQGHWQVTHSIPSRYSSDALLLMCNEPCDTPYVHCNCSINSYICVDPTRNPCANYISSGEIEMH